MKDVPAEAARHGSWRGGLRCLRAGAGLLVLLGLAAAWFALPERWPARRYLSRFGFGVLCGGFGLTIRSHGAPLGGRGVLYVANHVSWTDIPALALLTNAGFVAKRELRGWPIIGLLAARYGCLFVDRERRGEVRAQAGAIATRLEGAAGLVLFAEGTTGDGTALLPFRSSLVAGSARVQPVAIRYRRRDGSALSPEELRRVVWIGEDALLPHALALAAGGGAMAEVWFEPEVFAPTRKGLAAAARAAIVARLQAEAGPARPG